ncbi:MAG: SurA N-terminal domain-containing protein [Deltaproteobacteria bacterium]|nr:SurA N-terminal domain-containing protein [Deltaproteobacteria bacterium]
MRERLEAMNWAVVGLSLAMTFQSRAEAKVVDRIVAVVNDEIILSSEVNELVEEEMDRATAEFPDEATRELKAKELRKEALNARIGELVTSGELKKMNVAVRDEEVRQAIDDTMRRNKMDEKTFRQTLKSHGLSWRRFAMQIRRDLEKMRIMQAKLESRIKVSDQDIRSYYTRYVTSLAKDARIRLCQIHIALDAKMAAAERERRVKLADEIEIKAQGGEDFAALVKKHSEGAAVDACGDVGWLSRGVLAEGFERAAWRLKAGEVSKVIRSAKGLFVVKLKEREAPEVKPLEEIRDVLRGRLLLEEQEKQFGIWLQEARKKAFVDLREQ